MKSYSETYKNLMVLATSYIKEENVVIDGPVPVYNFMAPMVHGEMQEHVYVLALDTKNRIIAFKNVTKGVLNSAPLHPREVFRFAIQQAAAGIIICHNHPSGDPAPSSADTKITRQLVDAGKLLEIPVLDHVIIGTKTDNRKNAYYSMREAGVIV